MFNKIIVVALLTTTQSVKVKTLLTELQHSQSHDWDDIAYGAIGGFNANSYIDDTPSETASVVDEVYQDIDKKEAAIKKSEEEQSKKLKE